MQLKKTSKKIRSLINEIRTFSNGYFSFNNIDITTIGSIVKNNHRFSEEAFSLSR